MADVIELMLNQGAELKVAALVAVVGSQGDDEGRHLAEPIEHLLFHPGLLPATGAERYLLSLTQDRATLLLEVGRCPHDLDA
ncbi:hypothetical protein D3C75_950800 [compost metagenome]